MNILPEDNTLVRHGMKVSGLEELFNLSDDDYLLVCDTSEGKSVKVKLCVLADWLEKKRISRGL